MEVKSFHVRFKKFLSENGLRTIVHAFITSRLSYC